MLSRWLARFTGISTICLVACAVASAQYGGGGGTGGSGGTGGTGGSGGTGGYVAPSGGYGSGKAIGIGVGAAAGAAVAVVLLVRHHRHHAENNTPTQAYVTGCTQTVQNGIELTSEKDSQTYSVVSNDNSLKTDERVTLKGTIVSGDGSATPSFQVLSMVKDYGACGQASASNSSSLSSHSPSGLTNFRRSSADQLAPR